MNACNGDSGGAALLAINGVETIIAIDDYGAGPDCTGGEYYQRVDLEIGFVAQFLPSESTDASPALGDSVGDDSGRGRSVGLGGDIGAKANGGRATSSGCACSAASQRRSSEFEPLAALLFASAWLFRHHRRAG